MELYHSVFVPWFQLHVRLVTIHFFLSEVSKSRVKSTVT